MPSLPMAGRVYVRALAARHPSGKRGPGRPTSRSHAYRAPQPALEDRVCHRAFGSHDEALKESKLLKLKKLQILGFKSFCDRTELKFPGDGVAAIIGPNGCGKSNIADAISWVLGEQSAKTLRGSRMEDVIFAGTRDRQPTGMAEVSLTLIDPEQYDGPDKNVPTEVEVQDEMPYENWDEAEIRARAAEETERAVEEAQPGKVEQVEASGVAPQLRTASEVVDGATGVPPDEAGEAHSIVSGQAAALSTGETGVTAVAISGPPAVVLKIRRRKFNQQQY